MSEEICEARLSRVSKQMRRHATGTTHEDFWNVYILTRTGNASTQRNVLVSGSKPPYEYCTLTSTRISVDRAVAETHHRDQKCCSLPVWMTSTKLNLSGAHYMPLNSLRIRALGHILQSD